MREVWNGALISSLTEEPPKPPFLANPTALGELHSSYDRPLFASCRDAAAFFDQLKIRPPFDLGLEGLASLSEIFLTQRWGKMFV